MTQKTHNGCNCSIDISTHHKFLLFAGFLKHSEMLLVNMIYSQLDCCCIDFQIHVRIFYISN